MKRSWLWFLFIIPTLCHADLISGSGSASSSFLNSPTSQNANYNAACGDVVLASATAAGITITLPAASSCNGKPVVVTKVDMSTYPVTIMVTGADVVQGTQTLTLNAFTQTDAMIGSTAGQWIPWGQGLQLTPPRLYPIPYGQATTVSVGTSSNIVTCPFYTSVPVVVTGYAYDGITAAAANVSFGVLDRFGNVLTSTGPIALATGRQAIAGPFFNLPPGQYNLAVQMTNTGGQIEGISDSNQGLANCSLTTQSNTVGIVSITLPGAAVLTFPGVSILVSGARQTYL